MIRLKQICASCRHKMIKSDGTRICRQRRMQVKQKGVCKDWDARKELRRSIIFNS